MRMWIDADAAPREMKDIVFRTGKRLGFETILVANQSIEAPISYPAVRSVVVKNLADAADHYMVANAQAGDVAITADIALAALLVKKAVAVIDPRGEEYTDDNVGQRLMVRNFMEERRGAGERTGGPAPYGDKAKQAFAATLDRVLTRLRKRGAAPGQ